MSSSWTEEVETKVSAVHLFKAVFFTDWHHLAPKLVPDIITDIIVISGEGEPGSIRQINFTPAMPFSYTKEHLDFIDHEKHELKISVLEGGDLGKKFESISVHFKVDPKGNGSVVKAVGTYKAIHGIDVSEDIKKAKEGFIKTIKAVEEHLLAHHASQA